MSCVIRVLLERERLNRVVLQWQAAGRVHRLPIKETAAQKSREVPAGGSAGGLIENVVGMKGPARYKEKHPLAPYGILKFSFPSCSTGPWHQFHACSATASTVEFNWA